MKTINLFDLDIFADKETVFLEEIESILSNKKSSKKSNISVFTPNPEQIVQAKKNKEFHENLKKADFLLPDGMGLVFASKVLKSVGKIEEEIKERITGVEIVEYILGLLEEKKLKALIIGGRDYGNNVELVELGKNLFWTEAYSKKEAVTKEEETALEKNIKKLKPDIIFVALGAPYQEKWIMEHQKLMNDSEVRLSLAIGGSFDFIFEKVERAPQWMRNFGLEWLFRLVQEPWRWKRQTRLIEFLGILWQEI